MEELPQPGSDAVTDTATPDAAALTRQDDSTTAAPTEPADIRPDNAFEQIVGDGKNEGEPNLLSSDAPQE